MLCFDCNSSLTFLNVLYSVLWHTSQEVTQSLRSSKWNLSCWRHVQCLASSPSSLFVLFFLLLFTRPLTTSCYNHFYSKSSKTIRRINNVMLKCMIVTDSVRNFQSVETETLQASAGRLKFMKGPLEKDWSTAFSEGLPGGGSLDALKKKQQSGLRSCIWTNQKTSGNMSFGEIKQDAAMLQWSSPDLSLTESFRKLWDW